jgi:phage/plasmid primase-like uncharacterized protein
VRRFDLEELKARNPLAEVAARYTALHRVGARLGGACPICGGNPRKGRFEIIDDATWVCAVCQDGGDVIRLVERVESVDFKTAVERLGGGATLNPEWAAELAADQAKRRAASEKAENERRETERQRLYETWRKKALPIDGSIVQDYLKGRGLEVPLGYNTLRIIHKMSYYVTDGKGSRPRKVYNGPAMVAAFTRRDGKGMRRASAARPIRSRLLQLD